MSSNSNSGAQEMMNKLERLMQYIERDVPTVLGVEAVNHFKESFQNEGFTDSSLQKWASRKTKRSGGTNGQKILSQSGELADSIDYEVQGNNVTIFTDKPYAKIHNEGGVITVTDKMKKYFWAMHKQAKDAKDEDGMNQWKAMALSKTITVAQRQYMGQSQAMMENMVQKVTRDMTNILNGN